MKHRFSAAVAGLALLAAGAPLLAHHSVTATFDTSKVVTLKGVITEVTWLNPHSTFLVNVKDADGNIVNWTVELPPPNTLKRQGWNQGDLKQGDQVSVDVWRAKDGSRLGHALTVIFSSGRTVDFPRTITSGFGWQTVTPPTPPISK